MLYAGDSFKSAHGLYVTEFVHVEEGDPTSAAGSASLSAFTSALLATCAAAAAIMVF
jgi:hypothetical protein